DSPGGNTLPTVNPHYAVGILDTGSQSHVIRYDELPQFNLFGAGLEGTEEQEIEGASGTEMTDISDALGVYATGFGNTTSTGGTLKVTTSTLRGQWNIPILSTSDNPPSALPNIIGSPIIAHHEAVIHNDDTRRLNYNGTVYRSPRVDFAPLNAPETSE